MIARALLHFIVLVILVQVSVPAHAHLSMIMQGAESAGSREAGDRTGKAVAAGDFNGDGIDDLAIGAPDEGVSGVFGAGAVIIMWGTERGLDPAGTQILTAAGLNGFTTDGEYGYALVSLNFNGDAYDDLAVGAPGAAPSAGMNEAGMVYFYKGGPGGFTPWGMHSQAQGGGAIEPFDRFGASLAAGNFDLDPSGFDDLAVGSPGENNGTGSVSWFLSDGVNPPSLSVGVLQASDFGDTNDAGDGFGFSLASAHVIGGTEDDLIIGAPFKTHGTYVRAGKVYVKSGAPTGLTGVLDWKLAPVYSGTPQASQHFGYAVAAGKLMTNSGGFGAVAVGSPWRDVSGSQKSGHVYVFNGAINSLSSTPIILTQTEAGGVVEAWDLFGSALAVGRFWNVNDGWDDLAVGSPGDSFNVTSFAGSVNILLGGPSGPGSHGWAGYSQQNLNEKIEANDELGWSVAFGQFDGTNNGHLIVGAPGEDNDAGMVHVIAPWRQTYGLSCRNSIVFDCVGEPVFSQKPYDQVSIASTTKILTVLIGCERLQAGIIQWDDEYIVPAWVANQIPGSQVPLSTGEKMNFWDMLNLCLHLSGNDAAHALADWMHGSNGPSNSLPAFVDEMNARAAQLGMTASHFSNPNGFEQRVVGPDKGINYSTAYDMAILSREAMKNPLFADIADELSYGVIRHFADTNNPGAFVDAPMVFNTFYSGLMQNSIQPAIGIKGGSTNAAQITGCYAAENVLGSVWVAGSYYTPFTANAAYVPDAGNLLKIGGLSEACGVFEFDTLQTEMHPSWYKISTAIDLFSGGGTELAWGGGEDVAVEIGHDPGGDALAAVDLYRLSEYTVAASAEALLGVAPYEGHGELKVTNMGQSDAVGTIQFSYGAAPTPIALMPNESMMIPPHDPGAMLSEFEMLIMNTSASGEDMHLSIEECYPVTVNLGPASDPIRIGLRRFAEGYMRDNLYFEVHGMTPDDGTANGDGDIYVIVQDPGSEPRTSAPTPGFGPNSVVRLRTPVPNPFGASTQIRFDLDRRSRVRVSVFDTRGRLVRNLSNEERGPGLHQLIWDGKTDRGKSVAAGVYFYQVAAGGSPARTGKLTFVR